MPGLCVGTQTMITCTGALVPTPIPLIAAPALGSAAQPTGCQNGAMPAANIMAYVPIVNIATFGMCKMPSNPTVAAATAAALGVLTPMPCIPNVVAPWTPGSVTVTIGGQPALHDSCVATCIWGGVISVQAGTAFPTVTVGA